MTVSANENPSSYQAPQEKRFRETLLKFLQATKEWLDFEHLLGEEYLYDINESLPPESKIPYFGTKSELLKFLTTHQDKLEITKEDIPKIVEDYEKKHNAYSLTLRELSIKNNNNPKILLEKTEPKIVASALNKEVISRQIKYIDLDEADDSISNGSFVELMIETKNGKVRIPLQGADTRMGLETKLIPSFIFKGYTTEIRNQGDGFLQYIIDMSGVIHKIDPAYAETELIIYKKTQQ